MVVLFWRYSSMVLLFWRYSSMALLFWRYLFGGTSICTFSAVPGTSFFCGTFSAVMQYGGTFLAVPGISDFGGADFGGSR